MSTAATTAQSNSLPPSGIELRPNLDAAQKLYADRFPQPLSLSGALDHLEYIESTPVIGREYPHANIVDDIFNDDAKIRDLAITIAQRGVVFFRAQNNLTDDLQKKLNQRLGELAGKPSGSTLHIHPLINGTYEFGVEDNEISVISSKGFRNFSGTENLKRDRDDRKWGAASWHSDIQFEPYPADYTSLRLTELPSSGGDTLWASGYEIYDRFSDAYQKFFEGLSATFIGEGFIKAEAAQPDKFKIYEEPRGNAANIGRELRAAHPVVRTNPVTGWKSIYAIGNFPQRINELSVKESGEVLELLLKRIEANHDLQVRFKWKNPNDIAIWDNRSAFHSASNDYDKLGDRAGHRAVGIGEKPYLDPHSKSRTVALEEASKDS